ncbi:hypothetical protein Angca_009625 [Angiostrongylus cantonensis]|nr:hypothetical protein Angca_009625 [Angiostrongylus cantonensis]
MGRRGDRKTNAVSRGSSGPGGLPNQQNSLAMKADALIGDQLLPGRHPCRCQARIHALVRNCMGCGKIVCAQEGSGPCFFCGTLVCSKEETEVLGRGSQKSVELFGQLMGMKKDNNGGSKNESSLSSIGSELRKATQFRNVLIAADADSDRRTKVNDLESDYSSIENSPFLTSEEREMIVRRRLELKEIREKRRRNIVIDLGADSIDVRSEYNGVNADPLYDPVIESIIEKSNERQRAENAAKEAAVNAHWVPKGFVPKYDESFGTRFESNANQFSDIDSISRMNEEIGKYEVERQGYAIAIPQPCASLAVHGIVKYIRWFEDIDLKGPIIVCSTVHSVDSKGVVDFLQKHQLGDMGNGQRDYSPTSIMGRVYVEDCISFQDFLEEYNVPVFGEGEFVLVFSSFEPLTVPVPYISSAPFFRLEKEMLRILACVFSS